MKYSGNISFEFYIERYKNKITGEVVTDVLPKDEYLFDYEEVTLQIKGSSFFAPGNTFGRPEDSYPDEGNTEIESVIGPDQLDWEDKLTAKEREGIIQTIIYQVSSQEPDYNEDDEDSCFYSERYL